MSRARSTGVLKRSSVAHECGAERSKPDLDNIRALFEVGIEYQVASTIIVRQREDLKSPKVAQLQPGSTVQMLQMGSASRRARVRNESFGEGWISICDPCGRCFIDPNTTKTREALEPGDEGVRPFDYTKHFGSAAVARRLKESRAEECPNQADKMPSAVDVLDIDDLLDATRGPVPVSVKLGKAQSLNTGVRVAGHPAPLRSCSAARPRSWSSELVSGARVRLFGLQNKAQYNGKRGELRSKVRYDGVNAWLVKLETGEEFRVLDENLVVVAMDLADLPSSPGTHLPTPAPSEHVTSLPSRAQDAPAPAKAFTHKKGMRKKSTRVRPASGSKIELKSEV